MRLLLDQNLSYRLIDRLSDIFPGSQHVREVGLSSADDDSVWDYAKANGLILVSKDGDFHQRSFLEGPPPKVIWLRLGNCTTDAVEAVLRRCVTEMAAFVDDKEAAFLVLDG